MLVDYPVPFWKCTILICADSVAVPSGQPREPCFTRKNRVWHCLICGYATKVKSNIQRHQRVHTGERPYKCDHCGKAFKQTSNLAEHLRLHTGHSDAALHRPLQRTCPSTTKEKPLRRCLVCGYCTTKTSNLRKHQMIHTDERPYPCDRCPKAFKLKHHLVEHIKVHTGRRPFECHVCFMLFADQNNLACHLQVHSWRMPSAGGARLWWWWSRVYVTCTARCVAWKERMELLTFRIDDLKWQSKHGNELLKRAREGIFVLLSHVKTWWRLCRDLSRPLEPMPMYVTN